MTSPRAHARWWFLVVACVMLAVLSWLTATLLRLDRDERAARYDAVLQERVRLALWRLDSWLSPQLARESLRPAKDYTSFPTASTAWTAGFSKIRPGEVMMQSPLLGAESPLFRLHFEVGESGPGMMFCSPQVPVGNQRDFAEANGIAPDVIERAKAQLRRIEQTLPIAVLDEKVGGAIARLPQLGNLSEWSPATSPESNSQDAGSLDVQQAMQVQQSVQELDNRQRNFFNNVGQQPVTTYGNPGNYLIDAEETIGPLVPVWVDGTEAELVFARRVKLRGAQRLQAVLVDWQAMQTQMCALVEDLFGGGAVRFVRCEAPTPSEQPNMLASVPARLIADYRGPVPAADLPISTILWTTWGVTLLGLFALGFTLRTAIGFGERRARFASAVTHELRTPLTTFRMYSEMLADGIVTEPAAQQDYLRTLQRESDRLARVVENVLAWSRLEDGRFAARRERVAVGRLLDRVAPLLEQRLGEVDLELVLHGDDAARDAVVHTDEEAIGQILFNLIDNAAKYAAGPECDDRRVRVALGRRDDRVTITVCDRGPGVPSELRERVFVPFDRGAVRASSNDVPGVGLGLPLARGLARDLGGDLRLEAPGAGGACFVLELPLA